MGFLYVAILVILAYGLIKVAGKRYTPDETHAPETYCDFENCMLCRVRDGE